MDPQTRRLLVKLARLIEADEEDDTWEEDPEELGNSIPPLVFEARRVLDRAKIKWREE